MTLKHQSHSANVLLYKPETLVIGMLPYSSELVTCFYGV